MRQITYPPTYPPLLGLLAVLAATALFAAAATAQPAPPRSDDDRPPPPESLQACASLAAGAACEFKTPRGNTMKGSCWAPEGKPLACKPKDRPYDKPGMQGERPSGQDPRSER